MSDEEALGGAGDTQVISVDDRIQGLEHQLAQVTQIIQNGVKLETVGMEERELVQAALGGLNGGPVVNEVMASQYHQAKQQQNAEKLEGQQLQNQVDENVEIWETSSVM